MATNPFLKYIMKDEKDDIFHSSAYGKMAGGSSMGAASTQSFAERQKIERERKIVGSYGQSRLANNSIGNGPRAKAFTPEKPGISGKR